MNLKHFALIAVLCMLPLCTAKILNDLFCYECLNTDCPIDSTECQNIRFLAQFELDHLYHFGSLRLKPCPNMSALFDWRIMQMEAEACSEKEFGKTKCSVGAMQIETVEIDANGNVTKRYTHATVMGCGNHQLVQRIQKAIDEKRDCDSYVTKLGQTEQMEYKMEVMHCVQNTSHCDHGDFCVHFTESKIGRWPIPKNNNLLEYDYARETVIGIGIFSMVFAFVLGIGCVFLSNKLRIWMSRSPKIVDFEDIDEDEEGTVSYKTLITAEQQVGSN